MKNLLRKLRHWVWFYRPEWYFHTWKPMWIGTSEHGYTLLIGYSVTGQVVFLLPKRIQAFLRAWYNSDNGYLDTLIQDYRKRVVWARHNVLLNQAITSDYAESKLGPQKLELYNEFLNDLERLHDIMLLGEDRE